MQLTYYNNLSDKRYLNKNITAITHAGNPVTIKLLDDTNIITPTFKMAEKDLYMTANYCYVDDLHRYYYIESVTVSNGFAFLNCALDVLMTYKQELAERAPLVKRSENKYNLYQVDDQMKLLNYKAVKRVEFSGGFDKNKQEFMLCVIGNTTGGDESAD